MQKCMHHAARNIKIEKRQVQKSMEDEHLKLYGYHDNIFNGIMQQGLKTWFTLTQEFNVGEMMPREKIYVITMDHMER